jgi:hypothetical protein
MQETPTNPPKQAKTKQKLQTNKNKHRHKQRISRHAQHKICPYNISNLQRKRNDYIQWFSR